MTKIETALKTTFITLLIIIAIVAFFYGMMKFSDYASNGYSFRKKEYRVEFEVYYSPTQIEKKVWVSNVSFIIGSDRGSNYIYNKYYKIDTSAPIRVISNTYKYVD